MAAAAAQDVVRIEALAAGHATAPPGDPRAFRASLAPATELQQQELERQAPQLDRRARTGRVRDVAGAPVDILFNLAAILAEQLRGDRANQANALANRYLDVRPQGATGWALLPLFVSLRLSGEPAIADAILAPSPPRLVVIGGLSGTGKTTLSGLLAHLLGRPPGARVLHSDVFRKRLAGVSPEIRLPPAHYTRASDAETYEALFESADDHLACGSSVILDGTFLSRSERDVAEAIAHRRRVPFTGIWLEAPERDRIARVSERQGDASDAGPEVVRAQSRYSVGEIHWHRMRANRPLDLIVPAARAAMFGKR